MPTPSRREFLTASTIGLAAAGMPAGVLVLRVDARPTPASGEPELAETVLKQMGTPPAEQMRDAKLADGAMPTAATVYGPFYRSGAPFRAKVCPPFEPGTLLLVTGRVWSFEGKKPIAGAMLDVWHVDLKGKYSAGDGDFRNRARLITSESGAYEYETIHPVGYNPSATFWRSAHIHAKITAPGHKTLITEFFFEGDPRHEEDQIFNPALLIAIKKETSHGKEFEHAVIDVALQKDAGGATG